MSGFGDLDSEFVGYGDFQEVDDSIDTEIATEVFLEDALPVIPKEPVLSIEEQKKLKLKNRSDKFTSESEKEKLDKLREIEKNRQLELKSRQEQAVLDVTATAKDKDDDLDLDTSNKSRYKDPNVQIGKIQSEDFEVDISSSGLIDVDTDTELKALAEGLEVFSIEKPLDNQIASPTSAEFLAQYYRIINIMAHKIAINKLISTPINVDCMWSNGISLKTPNTSSLNPFVFDNIYIRCIEDSVIDKIRFMYEEKRVIFSKMTASQLLGAGHGISSAKQAEMYLEKMATVSISSVLSLLIHKRKLITMRNWFEGSVLGKTEKGDLLSIIQKLLYRFYKEQVDKYKNDSDMRILPSRVCFVFAKKYLNRHISINIPLEQLQITALTIFFTGIDMSNPNFDNLSTTKLTRSLSESESLGDSFAQLTYESHRHSYPINELSFF